MRSCVCVVPGDTGNCPEHGPYGRIRAIEAPAPNSGVVELLEKALAEARAGRMRGLVMVALHVGDETFTYNGGELVPHRALGAIEMMKYKILRDRMEW